jgi:hypothetical protein
MVHQDRHGDVRRVSRSAWDPAARCSVGRLAGPLWTRAGTGRAGRSDEHERSHAAGQDQQGNGAAAVDSPAPPTSAGLATRGELFEVDH